jgi:ribosomal protein S18 acetylase RimI-like enzyme
LSVTVAPEAVEEHQRELSERWAKAQGGLVRSTDEMLLFVVGEPVAFTNGVRRARLPPEAADRRIEEAAAVFRDHGVPAIWWVGPASAPSDLGTRLPRYGFRHRSGMRWLATTIDSLSPVPMPEGVEVHRVDSPGLQDLWLEAMTLGFGMDPATTRAMARLANAVGHGEDGAWQRFVALEGDRPVASSGLMLGAGLAGIYNVCTVPRARRRGIASAMTARAVDMARDLGYTSAVLGADSADARRLYESMGFRNVCTMGQYLFEP